MDLKCVMLLVTLVACASAHGHGHERVRDFGKFECPKTADDVIINTIVKMVAQETTAELITFLTAMNTTEGIQLLTKFNVSPVMITGVINQLKSNTPTDVAQAKASLQGMVFGIRYVKSSDRQAIFCVYQIYLGKLTAIQFLNEATYEQLDAALTALAVNSTAAPVRGGHGRGAVPVSYGAINFAEVSAALKSKGAAGLAEVKKTLAVWILGATPQQLKTAGDHIRAVFLKFPTAAPGVTTLATTHAPKAAMPVRIPVRP